ncbi:hypothetical protein SKAU_G00026680 [Synaphobranchus kaupii]|uniref:Uncharacterized protein n=1 Tax=Synaphobranchus kaupii TaxID=118154 RepID=A0A9Q1GCY5_SYNKA|nr:hypothetical protein SKAU_G00026680 [Synaphobranchus kaupii]
MSPQHSVSVHMNLWPNCLISVQRLRALVRLAAAELEGGSARRVSPVGSAAGSQKTPNVDQDPVTCATQQYLEVLKKNYMI